MKHPETDSPRRYSSPAVEQATQILFCLAASPAPQMGLTDICARVGVSGSKAFGILEALKDAGLVRRGEKGKGYALGTGLVALSRKVLDDLIPSRLAEPVLEELTRKTGSTSVHGLITGGSVYISVKREAEGPVNVGMRLGHVLPLTYGAHGKALFAFFPKEEQDRILQGKELLFHGRDKLDRERLKAELAQCVKEGFACDLGESTKGVNVVAAPVLGPAQVPIGFVEIFVLASAEAAIEFGPTVSRAAKALSRQLGAEL
jgi:DNA-binding IclR family transcriptional regulator